MTIRDRIKELRWVPADQLLPNPSNWRRHPKGQVEALRGAIAEIGFADALIAYETPAGLMLIDGHLRTEISSDREVPVLVTDLDEEEAQKLLLTLDPLAAMAVADTEAIEALRQMTTMQDMALQELMDAVAEGHLKPLKGIRRPDIGLTDPDEVPPEPEESWVQLGDLFQLGEHRVMCGDSTNAADIETLMGGRMASLIHADPPYGMNKGFDNDNLHGQNLDQFQMQWWNALRPHVDGNASAYIWGNAEDLWRLWYENGLKDSERLTFRNEIIWAKGSAGAGGISHVGADGLRLYPQETERCLFFMLGEQGFNNNVDNYWEGWEGIRTMLMADVERMGWTADDIQRITGVGMFGHWFTKSQWEFIPEQHYKALQAAANHDAFKRDHDAFKRDHDDLKREFYATRAYFDNTHDNMTDVWLFPRVTGEERYGHTTPKPVALIERMVKSSSADNAIMLDPFLGSGTTLIAAEKLDRICYGMEIEPHYVQVSIERWQNFTGQKAVRQ